MRWVGLRSRLARDHEFALICINNILSTHSNIKLDQITLTIELCSQFPMNYLSYVSQILGKHFTLLLHVVVFSIWWWFMESGMRELEGGCLKVKRDSIQLSFKAFLFCMKLISCEIRLVVFKAEINKAFRDVTHNLLTLCLKSLPVNV